MRKKWILLIIMAAGAALSLSACSAPAPAPTEAAPPPTAPPCPTAAPCPECPACPEPTVKDVPFEALWAGSAHAKADAEAFTHWDEEDPQEVPADCAKCHSTPGFLDYVGADGSAADSVEAAAPIGTVVTCAACHNEATLTKTSVTFPSGVEVGGLGGEAVCLECHQGRASKVQVDAALEKNGMLADLDQPNPEAGFINIHYFAAAATLYGAQTKGGYEYEGKAYDYKNDHVEGFNTCVGCHNSHTLELKVEQCAACHTNVASAEDARRIRMAGSLKDYDGDGDVSEGIAAEIEGLQGMLLQAIQAYAAEVAGSPIVYDLAAYPYFFIDTNANGQVDGEEAAFPNAYKSWTGRLERAAYNYQVSVKDPGSYAHGGKYIIQLLYDSIEDLNTALSSPVDLSKANRIDAGHFAGSEMAFRDWDAEGEVPNRCAKCHSATGLPTFLKEGVNVSEPIANGLNCATCHNDLAAFTRYPVNSATFPSGASITFGEGSDANLCITCHQGRESKVSVDRAIKSAGVGDDEVSGALTFRNPHYFAAGATLFGTEAKGGYEYDGAEYAGRNPHVETFSTCIQCHDGHALEVKVESCATCHAGVKSAEDLSAIRMTQADYDGDGDAAEGIAGEIAALEEALLSAIQSYAAEKAGAAIGYDPHTYPYFLADTNGNGVIDPEEANRENAYKNWTPRLLRAAYNYQFIAKDPGGFAHNGKYLLQLLYDSLKDLGADVNALTRP